MENNGSWKIILSNIDFSSWKKANIQNVTHLSNHYESLKHLNYYPHTMGCLHAHTEAQRLYNLILHICRYRGLPVMQVWAKTLYIRYITKAVILLWNIILNQYKQCYLFGHQVLTSGCWIMKALRKGLIMTTSTNFNNLNCYIVPATTV